MFLTDHLNGSVIEIEADIIGSVFNRGPFREVRTKPQQIFERSLIYKVRESVPEILQLINQEKENAEKENAIKNQ